MVMNKRMMWKQGRLIAMLLVPLLLSLQTWAQDNGQLRGVVMSDDGEKLQGTTVALYSLTDSLIDTRSSDDQGGFHFTKLRRGVTYKVTVSMMGYQRSTQEITMNATGTNSVLVRLAPAAEGLDEVVVVGYGEVKKRDLTGAVSSINSEELQRTPVQRVDQMLQGRAAGVQVTSTTGAPGAGTTIRIRGSRSVSASNEPLYVIDGIVGAGDLNTINPADIASIDVLKDASAAAIYGSRASNGVIIITTKKGTPGRDKISFSATHGLSNVPKLVDMMGAEDFVSFVNEAYIDEGQAPLYPDVDSILAITGPVGTNWQEEIFQTGAYTDFNLALAGGSNGFTYRISGNVVDQKGVVLNSSYRRYQTNVNLAKDIGTRLKIGLNMNIARYKREPSSRVDLGTTAGWKSSMLTLPPTMLPRNPDGSPASFNPIAYFGGGTVNTSLASAELITAHTTYNDLLGSVYAQYQILDGLTFRTSLGANISNSRYHDYVPSYMPSYVASGAEFGNASTDIGFKDYLLNENTLTYDKSFGEHHLNLLGGFTYQRSESNMLDVNGGGLTNDIVRWNDFASVPQEQRTIGSANSLNEQVSFIGRVQYNYANKYYLTVTNRYDGASNFAANKKWGYFPSSAVKWRIAEEEFFKDMALSENVLNDLSLRLSYGLSGNQGISNYQSLPTLSPRPNGYVFGGVPQLGYRQGNITNDDLTWETSTQFNAGLDLQLFNGRVDVTTNYYNMHTKNLLLTVQTPTQTGYANRLVNIGKTVSSGFEVGIRSDIINNKDFGWSTSLNFSTNDQEVTDLGPLVLVALDNTGYGATTNYLQEGVPIGANFGLEYAGVWHSQEEIDAELAKPLEDRTYVSISNFYKPGKQKYYDYQKDGELNIDDYHYLGTPNPPRFGGWGNTLRYKQLTLDAFLQFQHGSTMWNTMQYFTGVGLYLTNQMSYMKDRWTPENPDSDIPAVNSRDNIPSTYFLQNSSFLRLKSLTLNYDLSSAVFKQADRQLNVFLTGTNLFLLTDYNGYDPEVNSAGTSSTVRAKDNGAYPNSRTFAIGASLTF
ncbi:SusC/RagA family TonB-linked outer membrane protein [Sphingobacterium sp. SGR-19]|uniref:SusC/RagA family TonB-linked outer membrane protein n=1 Tax=Sphingobacterium sp. SGR-19 TaxID=2710886 RepID=UPI0013EC0DF7|nr:SusC/RagA family TonB-linked outer membrane protein [Sphingobacterium sp. SGR-19]NGM67339.1 SusC/RagA family TonB-linked outer membrane protein [Sphingobacterium sp. SGR-19]